MALARRNQACLIDREARIPGIESLRVRLTGEGLDPKRIATLKAPAGLDLGAITPEEIALSILAEIVALRRKGIRGGGPGR